MFWSPAFIDRMAKALIRRIQNVSVCSGLARIQVDPVSSSSVPSGPATFFACVNKNQPRCRSSITHSSRVCAEGNGLHWMSEWSHDKWRLHKYNSRSVPARINHEFVFACHTERHVYFTENLPDVTFVPAIPGPWHFSQPFVMVKWTSVGVDCWLNKTSGARRSDIFRLSCIM